MSELGDEAVSTGGAGGGQCVSAARTSELMSVVESVMPAAPSAVAPADSLPSAAAAAAAAAVAVPSSEERAATLLVTEDVTAHPAVRSKSETCRKRCRPNEVGLATQLSAVHTCAALRRAGYNALRVLTSGPVSTGIGDRGVFVYHLGM